MQMKSLLPGRYGDYQQFEAICKLRAGFNNVFMSSTDGPASLRSVGGDRAKHFLNVCPMYSSWFDHFAAGCVRRMGQEVPQDHAISMHELMRVFEGEWNRATSTPDKLHNASLGAYCVMCIGAYCVICFCSSFQGPEVFLTDLFSLGKYLETPHHIDDCKYVIIPLLGSMNNEHGECYHLTPLCSVTKSGLDV
jgi:hypothetical protein